METQAKHTPTPWKMSETAPASGNYEVHTEEDTIAYISGMTAPNSKENAEFIVKACNSYDKMRELLSAAYQKLYIADRIIDPYTEEDGEDIAGQLFSEGLADEIDTFLQNT